MDPRRVRLAVLVLTLGGSLAWAAADWRGEARGSSAAEPGAGDVLRDGELPRVRLVATGGTISVRAGTRLSADELLRTVSLDGIAQADAEQFANTASAALTLRQWLDLARRLDVLFRSRPDLSGIVVTTGTDMLEELGYFLNLTVRAERPVVVAGAMRSGTAVDSDGGANLVDAFRVAAAPESRGRGVLAVLNGEIHAAREVSKTDATRLDAFRSPGGPLGSVGGRGVVYHRDVAKRHTAWSEFDVTRLDELPRVDVLLVYQDASGEIINAAVDQGAQGLVIATAGAGATSGTQGRGIAYALGKGTPVVMSSRIPSGRIPAARRDRQPQGAVPPARQPVAAEDLAPLKARVLLMLALTKTRDPARIQQMFLEY